MSENQRQEKVVAATMQKDVRGNDNRVNGITHAKWIWTDDDPAALHVWVYARRRFDVSQPAGAFLDITADLRYFVWINGRPVGFGPPKFHWETPTFDRYPIKSFL